MFNSSVIEVAIGLVFIYLLLSLVCSSINETFASLINKRGKNLFDGIKNLLNDPSFTGLSQHLYAHGLVSGSTQSTHKDEKRVGTRLPSYLASNVFALALMDILGSRGAAAKAAEQLSDAARQAIAALKQANPVPTDPNDPLQLALTDALQQTGLTNEQALNAHDADALHDKATDSAKLIDGKLKDQNLLNTASDDLQKALSASRTLVAAGDDALDDIKQGVEKLAAGHTREALLVLIDKTEREVDATGKRVVALRQNVEHWFDDAMDRVGGWYKRWTQNSVLALGCVLVCVTNADTISIVQQLNEKDALRGALVTAAEDAAKQPTPTSEQATEQRDRTLLDNAQKLDLPLGWSGDELHKGLGFWALKLAGLTLTFFAVSLGAPFWFDTLSKFVNVRGAGTPPGATKKSARRTKVV